MANGGLPFFRFFDEGDPVIYNPAGLYKTLWPVNCILPDEVKEQIKTNFSNYFTNSGNPQYWLSRFHALVKREQDKWQKLLDSENALRPDDAIYNYDLKETTQYQTSGQSEGGSTHTGYNSETPEGSTADIETYMSAANKNVDSNNDSASSTGEQTVTRQGNIGVMTSAQILGGYRAAVNWCALEEVIFPALEKLFIMIWEEDADYGYLYIQD